MRRRSQERNSVWHLIFAAVSAIAAVVALIPILSRPSTEPEGKAAQAKQESATINVDSLILARQELLNSQIKSSGYERVYVVGEEKGFVDLETGFAFKSHGIYRSRVGEADGILSSYQLPDGTVGQIWRRGAGTRIDFSVHGRRYIAAVEDVDYRIKIGIIRIKEFAPQPG